MVGVNMRGGVRERTVSTRPCLSLTYAGVEFCGDTARVNVEFGRAFHRSGATLSSSLRASEAISSFERDTTSCVRARLDLLRANVVDGRAFRRAPHYVALNLHYVDVRTLQRVDGRGRGLMVADRG